MHTQIIQRNNAAVQLLRDGYYNDASVALKVALLQLQLAFRSSISLEESAEESSPQDYPMANAQVCCHAKETFVGPQSLAHRTPLEGTPIEFEINSNADVSDAYLVFYDRAFFLPLDESRERVISSVILYNCALASHISGVFQGNSENLTNALRLYKYAFRILQEVKADTDSTQLLLLALYNNMGHASFQLFHLDEAEHYVTCLRGEMGLSDSEPLGAALPTIEDDDYDFFCFNVAIRVELMGAPAA